MSDLLAQLDQAFSIAVGPVRRGMEMLGLHPTDLQAWALVVALGMLILGGMSLRSDMILRRRQANAMGTIVSIDHNDYSSPRVAFRDARGERHEFDSNLPLRLGADTVGDTIAVVYDPLNPRRAREAGRPIAKSIAIFGWIAVALLFLAYALGSLPPG